MKIEVVRIGDYWYILGGHWELHHCRDIVKKRMMTFHSSIADVEKVWYTWGGGTRTIIDDLEKYKHKNKAVRLILEHQIKKATEKLTYHYRCPECTREVLIPRKQIAISCPYCLENIIEEMEVSMKMRTGEVRSFKLDFDEIKRKISDQGSVI